MIAPGEDAIDAVGQPRAGSVVSFLLAAKRFAVLQPMGAVAAVVIILLVLVAVFAPLTCAVRPLRNQCIGHFRGSG